MEKILIEKAKVYLYCFANIAEITIILAIRKGVKIKMMMNSKLKISSWALTLITAANFAGCTKGAVTAVYSPPAASPTSAPLVTDSQCAFFIPTFYVNDLQNLTIGAAFAGIDQVNNTWDYAGLDLATYMNYGGYDAYNGSNYTQQMQIIPGYSYVGYNAYVYWGYDGYGAYGGYDGYDILFITQGSQIYSDFANYDGYGSYGGYEGYSASFLATNLLTFYIAQVEQTGLTPCTTPEGFFGYIPPGLAAYEAYAAAEMAAYEAYNGVGMVAPKNQSFASKDSAAFRNKIKALGLKFAKMHELAVNHGKKAKGAIASTRPTKTNTAHMTRTEVMKLLEKNPVCTDVGVLNQPNSTSTKY